VLRGERTCVEEPHNVLAKSLLPLVRLGRVDEARANHLRGYRMARGNPNLLRAIGRHIEFAALTGNEARGLEMLAEHADRLAHATDQAANRLGLLEGAAVLLRRLRDLGQDALEVRTGSATTVAALLPTVEAEIAEIGARFDRRNGTTSVSDRSRRRLATQPLLASLPLGVRSSVVVPAPSLSTMDVRAAGGRRSLDALIAEATRLADARDPRAARAWERVAATGRELPATIEARIAESRAVEAARTDAPDAVERFLDVATRFAAAGEPARALANRARAGLAAATGERAAPVSADPFAALAELDALRAAGQPVEDRLLWTVRFCAVRTRMVRWMAAGGPVGDDAHAGLDRELAEMIADAERAGDGFELAEALVNRVQVGLVAAGPAGVTATAPAQLDRAVEAYLGVGALAPAASAMLIRAQLALGADDPAAAEAHLLRARRTGGDLLDERSRAQVAALLAEVHLRRGEDGAAAAEALTAAHLFDGFDPGSAIRARRRAALAFERDGRPAEAAALLESVLPDLDAALASGSTGTDRAVDARCVDEIAPARHQYGRCLNALGEHREAARMFSSAATLVRDRTDQVPHASLTHEAGDALSAAGLPRDAEAAYRRAVDLWRAAGRPDAAVRAMRAAAWTLVQREDPDWAGALALFEEAATASDAERPETLVQAARLALDWPADTRPADLARRALAMADEAAAGQRGSGDPGPATVERALRAELLAAEALGGPLADPDAALARVSAIRQRAVEAGAKHLVARCDDVARRWER
jgi:tetratricopeptide (TPR) repeat protein